MSRFSSFAPLAPLALVALSLTALDGCSGGVGELPPFAPEAATPLAIAGPHEALVYTRADDEDPEIEGIQLTVRVDVDDEIISHVALAIGGASLDDVVAEDLAGRRAAFFDVTLEGADTPVIARAALDELSTVETQAILRALR